MAQAPETLRTELDTPQQLTDNQRRLALFVCIAAAFLTLLDVSIVTIALPSMETSLKMSSADITWTVAGYTLTFGLLLVPAGRLGDEFGRRRLFLLGLLLFTATAVLCAVAPDAVFLDASRLARGAAAGLIGPQVFGLIQQLYPPRERGRAFSYYGAAVGLSNAVGPVLGGLIIQAAGKGDGWRWIFWMMVPLSAATMIMGRRVLPADQRHARRNSLDYVGVGLLALAIVGVMLPLAEAGRNGIPRAWLIIVGAALFAAFVAWEFAIRRRGRQPLVDMSLFRFRAYWVGTLVAAAFYGGFTGIFVVLTYYFQEGLRYSALHASLISAVFTTGSAVCAIVFGRLIHRIGRSLVIAGSAVTALGLGAAAALIGTSSGGEFPVLLPVVLLIGGCGAGCVIAANQTLALHFIPRREGSSAGGVYQTGMKIGSSLGVAIATALFFSSMTSGFAAGGHAPGSSASGFPGGARQGHVPGGGKGHYPGSGAGSGTGAAGFATGSTKSFAHATAIGVSSSAGLLGLSFVVAAAGFGRRQRRRAGGQTGSDPAGGEAAGGGGDEEALA